MSDKLLSKIEVAELLNVSTHTLDRIVLDGMLPVYRVRGQCRFKRCDIDAYLDACREQRPVQVKRATYTYSKPKPEPNLPPRYYPGMKVV